MNLRVVAQSVAIACALYAGSAPADAPAPSAAGLGAGSGLSGQREMGAQGQEREGAALSGLPDGRRLCPSCAGGDVTGEKLGPVGSKPDRRQDKRWPPPGVGDIKDTSNRCAKGWKWMWIARGLPTKNIDQFGAGTCVPDPDYDPRK